MFNDRLEEVLEYEYDSSQKDFLNFNEYHCYTQNKFDFQYDITSYSSIDNMLDSSDLFDIPSSISMPRIYEQNLKSNNTTALKNYYSAWELPIENINDYFCSEKVSKINRKFNSNLMYNLSLNSPFFTEFFQEHKIIPLIIESVYYEMDEEYLTHLVKNVEKFSIFKNYVFYFTPIVIFGILVVFLLFRKLISEIIKYKEKYQ